MIKINTDALATLDDAIKRALNITLEALKTDVISAQVMPYDNGTMQNDRTSTDVDERGDELVGFLSTDVNQARRLYYHPEYNFQTVNNPNARGGWLEPWLTGNRKDFAANAFTLALEKELK